ncbi:MAG TPA: DUF6789 family protein [Ktedonobacteraceae bacterium]|jgi:hypothetical protein|nr:DUF6789 family protein [Ktedonobacteraceae bacterium]
MKIARSTIISRHWRPGQAVLAGLLATIAYSVAMEEDYKVVGNRFNDVEFIQGLLGKAGRSDAGLALAWLIHLLNGIALAQIYGAVAKRFLPGPNWLKGAIFSEAFVCSVWSLAPVADKYHPLIKEGAMPKLATWPSFWQNLLRHLIFGLTLGLLYNDKN